MAGAHIAEDRTIAQVWQPQWSPPLNGGSTPTHTFTDVTNIVPQWSPPSDGGSTWRQRRSAPWRCHSRNGARSQTAEHVPFGEPLEEVHLVTMGSRR